MSQKTQNSICLELQSFLHLLSLKSSFCVYLFGLESLVAPARDFYLIEVRNDKREVRGEFSENQLFKKRETAVGACWRQRLFRVF